MLLLYIWILDGSAFLCYKADDLAVKQNRMKLLKKKKIPTWGVFSIMSSDQGTHSTGQIKDALIKTFQKSWNPISVQSSIDPLLSCASMNCFC